jgi:DNA polymerase
MNKILLDFESRSEADIDVGAWNYSRSPSTRALCVAITNEDSQVNVYDLMANPHWPKEWELAVANGWEIHAHNAFFEYSMVTNCLKHWPQPHPDMWRDTMAKALCCGFPAGLGACAKALRLPDQKDDKGTALINFWCKPVASGGHKGEFRNPADHPERWRELLDYCRQDVVTEQAIDNTLPDQSDDELAFWLATWEQNRRGIHVDMALVHALKRMVDAGRIAINESLEDTEFNPEDLSNHARVLSFVQAEGVDLDSVAKARVKEALATDLPESARSVLEARQASGKTSVAKLDKLVMQVGDDGRLRDMIRPHGTSTGRDSSVNGVQLQNLPRGEKMDTDVLINAALADDAEAFLKAAVVKGMADPLGGVITCLRGCFAAEPGKTLFQCDWSAVEPRIGAWIVKDTAMLDAFRLIDAQGGVDIYQIEAAKFYGCEPAEIKGERRQFGKVYCLQNQYSSGEASIQRAAKDMYGLNLTLEEAKACKDHWREAHPRWVECWHDLERGALMALGNTGKVFKVGPMAWCFDGKHLKFRLPSGRIVWLPWAEVRQVETPWGTVRPALSYEFIHSKTKQWRRGETTAGAVFNVAVQGTGACLMRYATRNMRRRGIPVVLRVHDEMVAEVPASHSFDMFKKTMLEVPAWAEGLPINGAGWTGPRFRKD